MLSQGDRDYPPTEREVMGAAGDDEPGLQEAKALLEELSH